MKSCLNEIMINLFFLHWFKLFYFRMTFWVYLKFCSSNEISTTESLKNIAEVIRGVYFITNKSTWHKCYHRKIKKELQVFECVVLASERRDMKIELSVAMLLLAQKRPAFKALIYICTKINENVFFFVELKIA